MCLLKDYIAPVISFFALLVGFFSLRYALKNARKNIRLSIQQAAIKIAIEKAKDCNAAWDKSQKFYDDLSVHEQEFIRYHYDVISELVISKEIISKSFTVYSKLDIDISEDKEDYAYIFWKQLNTAIRGFFTTEAIQLALDLKFQSTYGRQLLGINEFIQIHNENQSTNHLFAELENLPEPT